MDRPNYLSPLALLIAAALAVSVLMVLWPTLPVQAQSEGADNNTGEDPKPTGKHLITLSEDQRPNDLAERVAAEGGKVENDYSSEIGVVIASGLSDEAAERLRASEGVQSVDRDMEHQWLDPKEEPLAVEPLVVEPSSEVPSSEVAPANTANPAGAFFYGLQWNMQAIKADKAWKAGRLGSSDVTVAILDTGIDAGRNARGANQHVDLQGLVDKTRSTSFVPTDDELVKANFPSAPVWTDLRYHGTHVAATVSSNALAAAGVTSKVRLMAVKVLGVNGTGADSGVLAGIMYAADNGADVINMSLGDAFYKSDRESHGRLSAINRAVNYADEKGTTVVVSAGNDGDNLNKGSDLYRMFCESPHVVCVSATGPASGASLIGPWTDIDAKASYSNFGSPIVVAAPGGTSMLNTSVWAACPSTSLIVRDQKGQLACRGGTTIIPLSGTSMAAPHVTGLAALLVAQIGKGHPSEVAAQIRESADDLGKRGKDAVYGHGRINIAKALGVEGS